MLDGPEQIKTEIRQHKGPWKAELFTRITRFAAGRQAGSVPWLRRKSYPRAVWCRLERRLRTFCPSRRARGRVRARWGRAWGSRWTRGDAIHPRDARPPRESTGVGARVGRPPERRAGRLGVGREPRGLSPREPVDAGKRVSSETKRAPKLWSPDWPGEKTLKPL